MRIAFTCLALLLSILLFAQSPQFAVVRPNGTTYICPTWDSSYNKAIDGDFIYMPGGTFSVTQPINKKLFIFGAGSNIDSSSVTGITKLNPITIFAGANNGSIEGVYFNSTFCGPDGSITFGNSNNTTPLTNYTISKCYLQNGIKFTSPCSNILIKNNEIAGYNCPNGGPSTSIGGTLNNSLISNNIIHGSLKL